MKDSNYKAACELSKYIIESLHNNSGDSYAEISRKIGFTQGAISHIIHKKRALSLDALIGIAEAYKTPLQLLLLGVTKETDLPEEIRLLYRSARDVLSAGLDLEKFSKRK